MGSDHTQKALRVGTVHHSAVYLGAVLDDDESGHGGDLVFGRDRLLAVDINVEEDTLGVLRYKLGSVGCNLLEVSVRCGCCCKSSQITKWMAYFTRSALFGVKIHHDRMPCLLRSLQCRVPMSRRGDFCRSVLGH